MRATDYIINKMTAGATQAELITDLTQALSAVPASDPNWGKAATYYNTGIVTKVVDHLVGNSVTAADKASAVDYMLTQMAAGQTFGSVVERAITALDNVDHADPTWGDAAALLDNRIAVSKYYSVDKTGTATDLAILKNILTAVTSDNATVATAEAAIDAFIIDLSSLDGSNGFRLDGAGEPVSSAGDINGDGFDDLIIGANDSDFNSVSSYLVFGKAAGFSATVNLSNLNGSNGFRLDKGAEDYSSGYSVSGAGDVNGDGFDDLIVGVYGIHPNGSTFSSSYVVFGNASAFPSTFDLSSLDGRNGFRLDGAGTSVSNAGDINGDGFADLLVSALSFNGREANVSYVVFGRATGFGSALALSNLDGNNGFSLNEVTGGDFAGWSVSGAGDVNGDGFDDLIIGAYGADPNDNYMAGSSYVVFGKASGFNAMLALSNLDGNNGFRLDGVDARDVLGNSVSNAGDVNGDGFDDLIVGANGADPNGDYSGSSYVVFVKTSGFSATFNLSNLDGSNGFRLDGVWSSGYSVSGAGDVNGDGFDDLIIGAFNAEPNGNSSGSSYVVFGKASGFSATINLSNLNGSNGFRLDGVASYDRSGYSVSGGGDVNGDGFDDLIVGSFGTHNAGNSKSSYVVFGGNFTNAVTFLGTSGDDSLVAGTSAAERFVAGNGNDTMTGGGGVDVFYGGASDDIIQVSDLNFQLVDGGTGNDILALAGSGLNLSLPNVRGRISDIETIDLTGTGNNTLTLTPLDVLNLSDSSNTLKVDGNAGDHIVGLGSDWMNGGIQSGFHTYTDGAAVLLVGVNVTTDFV